MERGVAVFVVLPPFLVLCVSTKHALDRLAHSK